MFKKIFILWALLTGSMLLVNQPQQVLAYNYGDFRSETLVAKAWGALNKNDTDAVLAYTNKTLELYVDQARKMQASLEGYPQGEKELIFGYWALNDVSTALFIQAEAFRRAEMNDQAKEVYQRLIDEFRFGQAWDTNGWFWKPAEAAKEKLVMLGGGDILDFGDYSSSYLTNQAWKALNNDNFESVLPYVDKIVELYSGKAKVMQNSLDEYPWQSTEQIMNYWALNDVGTSLYIKGEALRKSGKYDEARSAYKSLINEFFYAQCWDPSGWFWKPKEAAEEALLSLGEI